MTMNGVKCSIQIKCATSNSFCTHRGLRQGDCLASLFFNLGLEWTVIESRYANKGIIFNCSTMILGFVDYVHVKGRSFVTMRDTFLDSQPVLLLSPEAYEEQLHLQELRLDRTLIRPVFSYGLGQSLDPRNQCY